MHEHSSAKDGTGPDRQKRSIRDLAALNSGPVTRFGASLPGNLLRAFDELIARRGYANRSEALRDLIRDSLIRESWESGAGEQIATLTLLYDHSCRGLLQRMTELQHHASAKVLSSLHVHVSEDICLEVLVLRGAAEAVRREADRLIAMRGVLHGELVVAGVAG
ncbi:MAG: nickel-responsive transcriptional regulator NikR [Planctomycetota bacterium]|nr:nickel-responsive transcriptional regulator NikR [Planctomycetota bacterium]